MRGFNQIPRWKKVIVDFSENRSRLVLVIVSIFIGAFAVGLIMVTLAILPANLERTYLDANPANIIIQTDTFDQDFINMIARIPGVKNADGRRVISMRARVPGEEDWENLLFVAVNQPAEMTLKELEVQSGSFPQDESIVLVEGATELFSVGVGDQLEVQLHDDSIRLFTVSGTVKDFTADIELTLNDRVAYIDYEDLSAFQLPSGLTTLYVSVDGDANDMQNIEMVTARVVDKVEDTGRIVYSQKIQKSNDHPFGNYINALSLILNFIGIMIVVLSSFLVVNTMNSIMSEHTRQIGVMKLVGAQVKDIVHMYIVLVLLFGLAAFLLAVPSSAICGSILSRYIADILNSVIKSENSFPLIPRVVAVQAAITFLVPLASAILPILRGAGTSVRQALHSNLIDMRSGKSWINTFINKFKKNDGIVRLAMRNTFRNRGRLLLTLITLTIGGSLFIGVFNVQAMLYQHIENLTNYCNADLYLNFSQPYLKEEIIPIAEQIDGISYIEGWQTLTATFETEFQTELVNIDVPPNDSQLVDAVVQNGRWIRPDEMYTIVVNEDFYENYPNMQPGDTIILNIRGKNEEFKVVGIYNYTGLSEKRAYINQNTAENLLGNWSSASSYRLVTEDHAIGSILELEDITNETFRKLGYHVQGVSSVQVIVQESGEKINLLISVLMILAILTGLVGNIGLSGSLTLNVLDRTSEIGILRAVGANDTVIIKLVMYESFFISLVSYLIGAILSIPVSLSLGNMIMQAVFKTSAILTFSPTGYLIWFLLIVIMSIIASRIPARNATKLTIREVLAYE